MAASNPNVIIGYPLIADLPPSGYPYQYAFVFGGTADRDGQQGMFEWTGSAWTRVSFATNIPFDITNAYDGELMVYSGTEAAWTNMLSGAKILRVDAAVSPDDGINGDINLSAIASPNIGGVDLETGDRVFLYLQADPVQNGIYQYTDGSPFVRAASMRVGKVFIADAFAISVDKGDYSGSFYTLISPQSALIGTDPTTWAIFTGAVYPRNPATFLSGPRLSAHPAPEDWRGLIYSDLPAWWSGDSAFVKGGISSPYVLTRREYVSNYLNLNDPYDQSSALSNALQRSDVVILDKPLFRFNSGISATVLSGKTLICNGNGKEGPVTIQMTADSNLFSLAGVSNLKIQGTLHVQFRTQATVAKVLAMSGTVANIDIDHLIVTNGFHVVYMSGTVDNVHIGNLELNGFNGVGVYANGTDAANPVSNVKIDNIGWLGLGGSSNNLIEATDFVGAPGIAGITVGGGAGSGQLRTYLQTGTSSANAPMNCTLQGLTSKSSVNHDYHLNYGRGRTIIEDCQSYGAGISAFRVDTNFTGSAFLTRCAAELANQYGIRVLSTSMEGVWIADPRCVNNGQTTISTYSGIRTESGVGNVEVRGGISTGLQQKYAVEQIGTAPDNFLVIGVRVDGNNAGSISYTAGSTSLAKYCYGFDTGWL